MGLEYRIEFGFAGANIPDLRTEWTQSLKEVINLAAKIDSLITAVEKPLIPIPTSKYNSETYLRILAKMVGKDAPLLIIPYKELIRQYFFETDKVKIKGLEDVFNRNLNVL